MALNDIGDAHIARQIMAIRNVHGLNVDFLKLCLDYHIESIKQSAKGLIPGISREDVLYLILPIPPESYQVAVVERVHALFEILGEIEKNLTQ